MLAKISDCAVANRISFTLKARRELAAVGLGLGPEDARDILLNLTVDDSAGRLVSAATGEWMYVFKPRVESVVMYVKVILRLDCVLISFHPNEGADHDEGE